MTRETTTSFDISQFETSIYSEHIVHKPPESGDPNFLRLTKFNGSGVFRGASPPQATPSASKGFGSQHSRHFWEPEQGFMLIYLNRGSLRFSA